jgi:hypothetical protein
MLGLSQMLFRQSLGVCLVLWIAGGLIFSPGLLGDPGGEVWGHAWVQWWHSMALPAWPNGTLYAIGAERWPVVDPIPTAIAAIAGRLVDPVWGYNLWVLLSIGIAYWGGAKLTERVGGVPWVGGAVLALSPAFLGSLRSGLTEDGAVGLAALALAYVGQETRRSAIVAGLLLGLLCGCGLLLAWSTGLAAVLVGMVTIWHHPKRWKNLCLAAGIALILCVPFAFAHGDRMMGVGHRSGMALGSVGDLWRLNPVGRADLASLWWPGRVDVGDAIMRTHPGYLGISVLAVAMWARRPRLWLVFIVLVLASLGANIHFAGTETGFSNPVAWVVERLPMGGLIKHHGRLLLIAMVALAALAGCGARRLGSWAGVVVVADLLLLAPLSAQLPVADARPTELVDQLESLPPGPMLVLPLAGPGVHPQRALFDQRFHGRQLRLAPNMPGTLIGPLRDSETGNWLASLGLPRPAPPPTSSPQFPGVSVVLARGEAVGRIARVLGPPDLSGKDSAAWSVVDPGQLGVF